MQPSSPMQAARVEVWRFDLAALLPPTDADLAALDGDERRRHSGYLTLDAARIFATTRIALRRLIGARTRQPPGAVRLAQDVHGKPFAPDFPSLSFNVSHCSTEALIAFSDLGSVGIDIEKPSKVPRLESFTGLVCADAELRWLRANPESADIALERLWCRKEAISKAWGTGLRQEMSLIDTGDPGVTCGIVEVGRMPRTVWRDLSLPSAHIAAVAVTSSIISRVDVVMPPFPDAHEGDSDDC